MDFKAAIELIYKSNRIAILPHVSADGDAIGSTMGLYYSLKQLGKDAVIYIEEEIPRRFSPFTEDVNFVVFDDSESQDYNFDLCIAVDCGDKKRLGNRIVIFDNAKANMSLDHHVSNDMFAELNYVDTSWAAAAEGIYELILQLDVKINKEIARSLYIGLLTDTGSFRHSNTTSRTHIIAAKLMDFGLNVSEISQQVFDSISMARFGLGRIVVEITEFFSNGKIAICYIKDEYLEQCGATVEDIEGISDYIRSIEGVEVAIVIKDTPDKSLKVSMRSKKYLNVNTIAKEFQGGGHVRASGFTSNLDYNELKNKLIKRIEVDI